MKKCIYCNREINLEYLYSLENVCEIRCPYCYKELKVTDLSELAYFSIKILFAFLIYISPLKLFFKILMILTWIFISMKYLKLRIYQYEEIKK